MGWTNADNKFGPSSFVVTTPAQGLGNGANYTSIQQAITDAPAGTCVYIRGGVYTENITLKNGVSLYGVPSPGILGGGPQITGSITLNAALSPQTVTRLENLNVISGADDAFKAINAGLVRLQIIDCVFSGAAGFNGINLNNVSGTFSSVTMRGVTAGGDAGLLIQNHTFVTVYDSSFTGSVAGGVSLIGNSRATFENCAITGNSTPGVICDGTALQTVDCSVIGSGSLGYQITSGTVFIYGCNVDSTDASGFWVSGTGNLNYADVINLQNVDIDPALTITPYDWKPYADAGAAPGTGVTKGTCCFDSNDFSVVNGFVSAASGTGFVQTISADGNTAVPTAGNIALVSQSGAQLGFSAPSTIVIRAPLYTQIAASGLMQDNTVYFTTNAITLSLPATVQDGLCNGAVVTDAGPVVITPTSGTSKIRLGNQISSAGGTATSSAIGDVLILRYNTADDIWYGTDSVGNWTLV